MRTRSLIRFADIPQGNIVTDAVLSIYKYTTSNVATETLIARRITSAWSGNVTWATQPTVDETYDETQAGFANVAGNHTGWVNFNVWSIVKGWVNGDLPNYGFMIQHNNEYNPLFFYYSSESPTGFGPLLSLTYITDEIGLNPYWSYANIEAGAVNTFNGNLVSSVADFSLPGRGMPISITRTYNSRGNLNGIFGNKWFSNLDMQLVMESWGVVLIDSAGTERPFMLKSDGLTYAAPSSYPVQLYKETSGGTTVYRVQEAYSENSTYQTKLPSLTFNSNGKLTQLNDGKGNTTTITRVLQIIFITDPSGRSATLTLNSSGYVNQIITSAEPGKIKASYVYNNGYLTSVTYDNSPYTAATVNYEWKDGRLSSLSDKNGNKKYINYDGSNQVISIGTKNMLSNPSLEASADNIAPDNWMTVVNNDNGSVKIGSIAKYGKNGLNITSVNKPGAGMSYLYAYQDVSVKPGTAYSFSAYIKTSNLAGKAFIQVEQLDASGNHISWLDTRGTSITGTNSNWENRAINFTAASNAATARLYLETEHDASHFGGSAYFDGAQFELGLTAGDFEGHTDFRYGMDNGVKSSWVTTPVGELVQYKSYNYGTPAAVIVDPKEPGKDKSEMTLDWDASDRLRSITTPEQVKAVSGKKYSYQYDAVGNMIKSTDPLDRETSMDYYFNHLKELTQADGNKVQHVWDPVNLNRETSTNQTLNSNAYSYDSENLTLQSNLLGIADNRVLNSNFENLSGDQPVDWSANTPAGTIANKIEYDNTKESNVLHINPGSNYTAYQTTTEYINLTTNGIPDYFTISGDVKAGQLGSAEGPALRIIWYRETVDANGVRTYTALGDYKIPNIRSTEWQRYTGTVESPQQATHARVQAVVYGANNNGYFDNIQLEKSQLSRGYNFIENSSFERGNLKWALTGNASIVNAPGGYSGDYYAKISHSTTGNSYFESQTVIPVKHGEVYTLLGYIETSGIVVDSGNGGAFLYADYYDSSNNYLGNDSTEYIKETSGWTKYALILEPPVNSARVKILLRMYNAKGDAYFDNIRLSPGRLAITNSYDANKNYITSTVDQLNNEITIQSNPYGLPAEITAPGGESISYTYDGQGRMRTATDNANNTATYSRDANGNVTNVKLEAGVETYNNTTFTYDVHNNVKTEEDALNNTTSFYYDETGRLIKTVNPNNSTAERSYNSYGDLEEVDLSTGQTYNYEYDLEGRLTTSVTPGSSNTNYQFDEVGNLTGQVQKDGNNNILTTISAPDTDMYSEQDQLLGFKMTHKSYTSYPIEYNFSYTRSGLVNSVTGDGKNFGFNFDEGNNLVARQNSNNTKDKFTYNESNKVSGIQTVDNNNNVKWSSRFEYNSDGRITGITGNGPGNPSSSYTYNNGTEKLNRLTNAVINDGSAHTFNYYYDAAGNITSMSVANGNGTISTVTFNYDGDNRITGNSDFAYDNNGNLIKAKLKGTVYQYSYDALNRLTQVKNSSGTVIASYTYDGEGRRLTKTANGETITYHYFGGQLLYETSSNYVSGNIRALYIRTPQGKLLAVSTNYSIGSTINNFYYYHYNGHGDVTVVTDSSGNVYRQYVYDPYGNIISVKDGSGNTVDINNDTGFEHAYTYAGYRYDKESGLYFLNSRYYAAGIGRFLTKDIIAGDLSNPKSLNRYAYAYGEPANLKDTSGYDPIAAYVSHEQWIEYSGYSKKSDKGHAFTTGNGKGYSVAPEKLTPQIEYIIKHYNLGNAEEIAENNRNMTKIFITDYISELASGLIKYSVLGGVVYKNIYMKTKKHSVAGQSAINTILIEHNINYFTDIPDRLLGLIDMIRERLDRLFNQVM
ncbi:tRNA(Glu)-specific nuclease WapA precursor [Oxobacter pfennigii]|uniref:tRNA(Glu)-specific nuclease WapA n=1 Tax=Oxobacter pfennigii TaxID=36849 RepID=A0A0P8W6B7_9CLOT|nr:DNRLRE domain-containing protein [Oxobacter pfennigii]KPU44235.1 tRNA(Glu)-specific nuclease WapA precursor [Oxobacter pfennigii]